MKNLIFFIFSKCNLFSFRLKTKQNRFVNEIMEIKNEYYKPRSLGTNNELDVIMDAILNQNAMAMDSAYVDDVRIHTHCMLVSIHFLVRIIKFYVSNSFVWKGHQVHVPLPIFSTQ